MQGIDFGVLPPINSQRSPKETFMSQVDEWEKTQEASQKDVVALIKNAYEKNATVLNLEGRTFTTLPPIPPTVTELKLYRCTHLKELNHSLPNELKSLDVGGCTQLQKLPTYMPFGITHLGMYGTRLTEWPAKNLTCLTYLDIDGCCEWKQLADHLPANLRKILLIGQVTLHTDQPFLHRVSFRLGCMNTVKTKLQNFAEKWNEEARKIDIGYWYNNMGRANTFNDYFTKLLWENGEARGNPAFFAEQQLLLLTQMDQHTEIREKCFDIAELAGQYHGSNPLMGFLNMRERAREIEMLKPETPLTDWFAYVSALKNKIWLEEVINSTDYLSRATIGGGEQQQTEALLMLYFLCHQKDVVLPVPYTSVGDEEVGWKKFGNDSSIAIKAAISRLFNEAMPRLTAPDAHFFVQQPVWLKYLDQKVPAIAVKKATIIEDAKRKISAVEAKLFSKAPEKPGEGKIDEQIDPFAITRNRQQAINDVYLDETTRLLNVGYCTIL